MPNLTKEKEPVDIQIDMAGLAHLHRAYLRGVKSMILSAQDLQRSNEWRSMVERMLISSGYMNAAEVKWMDGDIKVQRYLTEQDAKLRG